MVGCVVGWVVEIKIKANLSLSWSWSLAELGNTWGCPWKRGGSELLIKSFLFKSGNLEHFLLFPFSFWPSSKTNYDQLCQWIRKFGTSSGKNSFYFFLFPHKYLKGVGSKRPSPHYLCWVCPFKFEISSFSTFPAQNYFDQFSRWFMQFGTFYIFPPFFSKN